MKKILISEWVPEELPETVRGRSLNLLFRLQKNMHLLMKKLTIW